MKIYSRWTNLLIADLDITRASSADLAGADLCCADLRGANLSSVSLVRADLTGANLSSANLRGAILTATILTGANFPDAPIVPNIDAQILKALESGGRLNMNSWHTCETTHCRAGWAITLAGEAGKKLEAETSSFLAGYLIYKASRPGIKPPNFYAPTSQALKDIKRCAATYLKT